VVERSDRAARHFERVYEIDRVGAHQTERFAQAALLERRTVQPPERMHYQKRLYTTTVLPAQHRKVEWPMPFDCPTPRIHSAEFFRAVTSESRPVGEFAAAGPVSVQSRVPLAVEKTTKKTQAEPPVEKAMVAAVVVAL
jgi:hypothetical protein